MQVQCLEVMKEERGQESTYLIITQIKAYIMDLLLLLLIFIWSAVNSIMVTIISLQNGYQILKLYSSTKDNLKIFSNKERIPRSFTCSRNFLSQATFYQGKVHLDGEKHSTFTINLCCLFRLAFNQTN